MVDVNWCEVEAAEEEEWSRYIADDCGEEGKWFYLIALERSEKEWAKQRKR